MPIPATQFIWFNGKLVPWEKATVHVLSHALHYGSSVFEGVRAYETPKGVAIFRLRDHTRRLFDSAKIYRIPMPFSPEQLNEACRQVIAANDLKRGAYLRPVVFRGYGEIGVTPKHEPPTEVAVAAWAISCWLRTVKSSSRPGRMLWRCRSSETICCWAASSCCGSAICTLMFRRVVPPITRFIALVYGMITMSSWSTPWVLNPLGVSIPVIVNGTSLIRKI